MEIWKEIPGMKYEVSNMGNVRRVLASKDPKIVKQWPTKNGSAKVVMNLDGTKVNSRVHNLVWKAFRGNIPESKTIMHLDGDKWNNKLTNLYLVPLKDLQTGRKRKK